jgi:hypothetical protein
MALKRVKVMLVSDAILIMKNALFFKTFDAELMLCMVSEPFKNLMLNKIQILSSHILLQEKKHTHLYNSRKHTKQLNSQNENPKKLPDIPANKKKVIKGSMANSCGLFIRV